MSSKGHWQNVPGQGHLLLNHCKLREDSDPDHTRVVRSGAALTGWSKLEWICFLQWFHFITFQIKLAIQVILDTTSRSEYCMAKQMRALRQRAVSVPGLQGTCRGSQTPTSLLAEHPTPTNLDFAAVLHWGFRTDQADWISQMLKGRNQRGW